jgi:hypothetical protein
MLVWLAKTALLMESIRKEEGMSGELLMAT